MAEALGLEHVERAVDRERADGLSGVNAETQAGARRLGIDLLEELGGGKALVAADADANDVTGLILAGPLLAAPKLNGLGENLLGLFGAEVAHGVEDPIEADAEILFRAQPSALHALEERIELLAAPENDADADEDLGMQAAFGGELFDHAVGDELEVLGIAQPLGDRFEGDEKAGEIRVVVERGGFGDGERTVRVGQRLVTIAGPRKRRVMLLAELAEGQRIDRAFEMKVQLGLGKARDEVGGHGNIVCDDHD